MNNEAIECGVPNLLATMKKLRDEIFDCNIGQRILKVVIVDVGNFADQLFQVLCSSKREKI